MGHRNEYGQGTYELLKSADGKNFTPVKKFNASTAGNYAYSYVPDSRETGKIYFRIKQEEPSGTIKYSPLRTVDLGKALKKKGFSLFSNPVKVRNITIVFNDESPATYDIQLINLKGQTVRQMQVSNALKYKIHLTDQIQAGNYFVLAVNRNTRIKTIERLIIQ